MSVIIPTIHAFAIPDKDNIIPMLYHLRGAGMKAVIFPVPPRAYASSNLQAGLGSLAPWLNAARRLGISPILDVGPWFDVGLPAWGLPDRLLALDVRTRDRQLRDWWHHVRDVLQPERVIVRREPMGDAVEKLSDAAWHNLLDVWEGREVWDVSNWAHLNVRWLAWQEWEADTAWWGQVDAVTGRDVWVQPWWVEPGRLAVFPTPETVHEALGREFVQALVVSLLARGVQRLVWDPVRSGILWGEFPPPGWGSSLDGGAALREFGGTTSTWHALRRLGLQIRGLHLEGTSVGGTPTPQVEGEVEALGVLSHEKGQVLLLRRLAPGEVTVRWRIPGLQHRMETTLSGPGGWLFPFRWTFSRVDGELVGMTGDFVWREVREDGEVWIADVTRGMDWVVRLDGELLYETGAEVRREGDLWHVHFDAGRQGQVVWSVGGRRLQVLAVGEETADRVWPAGSADDAPLFMGPERVLDAERDASGLTLRVSTTQPTGFVAVDARPWRTEVRETGKHSVWGERAGMGGVRLGGPKEWGAPRVTVPDLVWTTTAWDGPFFAAPWTEADPPMHRTLFPGWYWFQADCPPDLDLLFLRVQGVCDVWLGDRRVAGVRSPDTPRERRLPLPARDASLPLTLLLWVPSPAWNAVGASPGFLHVEGADRLRWRYRTGVRGVTQGADGRLRLGGDGKGQARVAALYVHRARFRLDVPDRVWVQFGLALGDVGELVWVFVNRVLVGQWWAGRSREVALWLPWDVLRAGAENEIALLHWPRAREGEPVQATLTQLCRERVSTIEMKKAGRHSIRDKER